MGSSLSCSSEGSLLLTIAANGDLIAAQELLRKHPKAALHNSFKDRSSPLLQAAARGHLDVLQLILETAVQVAGSERAKRFVIDHVDKKKKTALSAANKHGHASCVEYLVANGANPLCVDSRRHNTCLHTAVLHGHVECVNKLLGSSIQQQGRTMNVSQLLCQDEDASVVRFVDRHNGWGLTAMHIAVFQGSVNTVRALLRHGASLDPVMKPAEKSFENSPIRCSLGSNALHIAAHGGNILMVKVILEAQESVPGLDLRSRTNEVGMKPGDYARSSRNPLLMHILDESLPVSLLRQIWLNYSLDHSMPPRHQTLDAMLQKLRLMFNLEIIAVRRNLAHSLEECGAGAAGQLVRSSSSSSRRQGKVRSVPLPPLQLYQQLQQQALWGRRLDEVQLLLSSVTRLHASLHSFCRRADESTEWPSACHAAVLEFILSTLVTPRTVSAIVYAAKKLVCSNVMAVVAASAAGSTAPAVPAEMDVQHGIALLGAALRAVETCLQTAAYLSNPVDTDAAAAAAAANAAPPLHSGAAGASEQQQPVERTQDGSIAPGSMAQGSMAASVPGILSSNEPQLLHGAQAQAQPPALSPLASITALLDPAGPSGPAGASVPPSPTLQAAGASVPPVRTLQAGPAVHWSALLHSVIAQLQWDISVQRHRRRRQHQAAARAAAAAAGAEAAPSQHPPGSPEAGAAAPTTMSRHHPGSRSAPSRHLIAAYIAAGLGAVAPGRPNVAGGPPPPLPAALPAAQAVGDAPLSSRRSVVSVDVVSVNAVSVDMLCSDTSPQEDVQGGELTAACPAAAGASAAGMSSVLERPLTAIAMPQCTGDASSQSDAAPGISGGPACLGACVPGPPTQPAGGAGDKRGATRCPPLAELSEDLSGGEDGAGSEWSDEDSTRCAICMDKPMAVQVMGCEHGLCVQCAFQLTARGSELPCCPFCRQKIAAFEARHGDAC